MANSFHITTLADGLSTSAIRKFQIVSYNIHMTRSRIENGMPYGPIMMKQAEVVVKLEYNTGAKVLYDQFIDNQTYGFKIYKGKDLILEMQAYIVKIEESYSPSMEVDANNQRQFSMYNRQITAKISFLVTELRYLSANTHQDIKFG